MHGGFLPITTTNLTMGVLIKGNTIWFIGFREGFEFRDRGGFGKLGHSLFGSLISRTSRGGRITGTISLPENGGHGGQEEEGGVEGMYKGCRRS